MGSWLLIEHDHILKLHLIPYGKKAASFGAVSDEQKYNVFPIDEFPGGFQEGFKIMRHAMAADV